METHTLNFSSKSSNSCLLATFPILYSGNKLTTVNKQFTKTQITFKTYADMPIIQIRYQIIYAFSNIH